jgi:hypothetical protein
VLLEHAGDLDEGRGREGKLLERKEEKFVSWSEGKVRLLLEVDSRSRSFKERESKEIA